MTIKKILVPVDYSDSSEAALGFAADIANRLGAELDVVHAGARTFTLAPGVRAVAASDLLTAIRPLAGAV